ncbi:MAG: hypothetical protein V2I46_14750 [Bacteroides sp.]|jgi:hypothetical protein|nr:hypothetical protein [Bacteroides sp.]
MIRRVFTGVLLIIAVWTLAAQEPVAEMEAKPFPPRIRETFSTFDRNLRPTAEALADSVQGFWEAGGFSESQKDTVAGVVDILLGGRYSPWPDLGNYLEVLLHIRVQQDARLLFSRWHEALAHSMQTHTPSRTAAFIERSKHLFLENTLFQSGAVRWLLRNGSYVFDFRDNEPVVDVKDGDLVCLAYTDSTVIYRTTGQASLDRNTWEGKGGKFTWQRTLFDPEKVYAELNHLELDLSKAQFEADSVAFFHLDYFDTPLQGRIRERVVAEFTPESANFPVFESYQREHQIHDVFPGIHYTGGFSIHGSQIEGANASGDYALVEVFRGDTLVVVSRSKNFVIRPDRLMSDRASFTLILGRDSIWHPNLLVRYLHEGRELSAMRDERGYSRAPFYDTYHRLDLYCEALYWDVDSTTANFQMIKGVGQPREALFESHDFFSQARYDRVKGIDDIHPLSRLSSYARAIQTPEFYLVEYSRFFNRDAASVRQELFNLSFQGFIQYDDDDQRITINEKLYHYILSNAQMKDYDVMQIRSTAPVNASLNIQTFDLELKGIERIPLSTAKNVVIYPNEEKVVMQANRNMAFDGRVESGLFDFYGKDFFFEYDLFKITLENSDSLSFSVRAFEPDSRGRFELVKVKNVLESINGELLVDHPSNKSGQHAFSGYPSFTSINESYVFYDNEGMFDGAYQRDSTYFKILPFTIENLDKASTDNIAFGGVFVSNGILPEFEDYLTVQRDYTLGFNTETAEGGIPVYAGKANYTGPLTMSSEGLVASGRLNYLSSVVEAEKLVLLPEEAVGTVRNFELEGGGEADYPAIHAEQAKISFVPGDNTMQITNTEEAIGLYDGKAGFKGDIMLTPTGLSGTGQLDVQQASIRAGDFVFRENNLISQRSDMEVVAPTGKQAFVHEDFSAAVDMENLTGTFSPVDQDANISFPAINLLAENYDYDWDIEEGLIDLRSSVSQRFPDYEHMSREELMKLDFSGYEMVFTDPVKDSLRFFAPKVFLELKDYNLNAEGVPLLRIADAAIFPDQGVLIVDAGGVIRPLENAVIVANTENQYHTFYGAGVEISSSKQYTASGNYDYRDKDGKVFPLFFESIKVNREGVTFADATLPDSLGFSLGPRFAFFGDAQVQANEQFLRFDGYSKIDLGCPGIDTDWFSFEGHIDPMDIRIPVVAGMMNPDRREVSIALMLAGDSLHIYPAVFLRRHHYLDREIISAYGYVMFDEGTGEYLVSENEKLDDLSLHHNLLRISERNCNIQGEGLIDLGVDLGQFKMENYGTVHYDYQTDQTDLELVMGLDFFFAERAFLPMVTSVNVSENRPLNLNSQKFRKYLLKHQGPEQTDLSMSEYLSQGVFNRLPEVLERPIMLGDVRLRWNQPSRSFISYGLIGLINLEEQQVIRQINGHMEVRKSRGGDTFTLLVRSSESGDAGIGREWYFFNMNNNQLKALSSVAAFNEAITKLKPRQRQRDRGDNEPPYSFTLEAERRPYDFFHFIRQINFN